jgi:hypothetical protein
MRCRAVSLVIGACALLLSADSLFGPASTARADGPPAGQAPAIVAVTTGTSSTCASAPASTTTPSSRLEEGSVVVIVERAGEWLGVRLPAGLPGRDLRHAHRARRRRARPRHGDDVNLRVRPPEGDRAFAVFRDRVARGTVLP